jgi:hypothetical protein
MKEEDKEGGVGDWDWRLHDDYNFDDSDVLVDIEVEV